MSTFEKNSYKNKRRSAFQKRNAENGSSGKSGETLFLDEGALVYASVCAVDAENIRILGRGILDNGRNKEKNLYEANVEENDTACANAERRNAIDLVRCRNAEIDGIVIRDSLVYNIDCVSCENVNIRNIKIQN